MALTNQQVQAAYLAIIGRPAEGSAVTWAIDSFADLASLVSSIIDIRKGGDFSNNKETFVENLYQNLLGRASDAEGKEFWLKALNDGASYAQVAQGFINAVLGQSQTEDLYKLQNKLDVAEKISAQINTFQGGAAAEATLKALMKDVNANTTIDSIQDSVDNFVGNSVNIKTVTINPADTDPAKIEGSAENATVFNLSLDVASENPSMQQELKGSTKFADTLNVKVTSSDKEAEDKLVADNLGTISNIKTLNITTDATIATSTLGTINAGVKNLTITGTSDVTVNTANAVTVVTGGGDDTVTVGTGVKSVNLGAGNDTLSLSGDQTALTSVLGVEKLTLANATILKSSILSGKDYNVTANTGFVVDAKGASTVDLGSLTGIGNAINVNVNNVANGATVTLNAANGAGAGVNTVKALATSYGIKVSGAASGDKLDFKANSAVAGVGTGKAATAWDSAKIGNQTFKLVNDAKGSSVNGAWKYITDTKAADTMDANGKALFAFNDIAANKSYIYLLANNADTKLELSEVKLLATLDTTLTAGTAKTDDANAGEIVIG
ncbi:MAG: DUF4214 domain-containing protein [Campylobacter sp.]|nr:DUF4214 domain-containing protein [Campylobacter sp.]